MRVRHLITFFLWFALTARSEAQTPGGVDKAIANLRQVADNLNDAVKTYQAHLDREIALHDSGYRAPGGRRIPGADADFNSGQAGVVQAAIRKLFAARVIAARRPGYSPTPLEDARHIQDLIADARNRIDTGSTVMRRLLVVSASQLNPRTYAEQKASHDDLMKARNAAVEAAKRALVALPIALPEADTPEDQREKAWDLMAAKRDTPLLPIRFEEGKRIVLVNEHFCRVTLTDPGIEDRQGRHLFYEEEWMTRQGSIARTTGTGPAGIVVWKRWAVAVNTTTGQHTMLRRYETREFQGDFDDLYQLQEVNYVPNPAARETAPPSMQELTSAVASCERSRDELRGAVLDFRRQIRDALTRNDSSLDDDLPPDLRDSLFAIRAHLAGTAALLKAENRVRLAVEEASGSVRALEAIDAWVNGNALEKEAPTRDSRVLLEVRSHSDAAIYLIRSLQREARAALPPDISTPEALLPALKKDFIVRIRRMGPGMLKQEVWRIEGSPQGFRQVRRSIVTVEIQSKSGSQVPLGREVKYYPLDPGDSLEEIYDENAAQ